MKTDSSKAEKEKILRSLVSCRPDSTFCNRALLLALLCLFPLHTALGNDLRIENIVFIASRESSEPVRAVFDVSWSNAWHNERNHDAAWIFLKLRVDDSYVHVRLEPDGHRVIPIPGSPTVDVRIDVADGGTGLFLFPSPMYRGDVSLRLSTALDTAALQEGYIDGELEVFGIEMVYIPEEAFFVGDPGPLAYDFGAFFKSGANGMPEMAYYVESEDAIELGPESGLLHYRPGEYEGDAQGPIPESFPKGYDPFYVMKYEITQGQYASFLNTLSDDATFERTNFGGRSYFEKRGTIRLENGTYVAGKPQRPMNFMTWDDGLAFADWAGLRPMTELEFAKAARGPAAPEPGAFPWGSASREEISRVVGQGDDLVMTNGWDENQLTDATRAVFGASYYWVMDLAGSVWERVISVGNPDGRVFAGSHGDGNLGSRGRATNDDWPHTYSGRAGHGYRGGGFYDQGQSIHEFNPYSPVSYRRFGAWSGSYPHRAYGFRCVRTAD